MAVADLNELEIYKRVGVDLETYLILREVKKSGKKEGRGKSMARLVCDAIKEKYSDIKVDLPVAESLNDLIAVEGAKVNELIELFKDVNPSYQTLFARKPQRKAIEDLVKQYGYDKVSNMIKALKDIIRQDYAPVITTPVQLQSKLGALVAFVHKHKAQNRSQVADIS